METRFLETFLTVVKAGSIAAAARVRGVAPTTIAQQIKALEKDMGCTLLLRAGHTVKPSPAGYRVLERAQHLVRDARDLGAIARTDHLPPGPLLLGVAHFALMRLLPEALKTWNNLYPGIGVFIQPGDSVPLFHQVTAGDIDAAIIGDPLFKTPKTCGWHVLRDEELVLVTPKDMNVLDTLAVLRTSPFIRFDRSYMVGKLVDGFLRTHNIMPESQFELDGVEVITRFIGEGLGVSILPKPRASHQDGKVRYWPLPPPVPRRKIGFIWALSSVRAPLAAALLEILNNAA